ncbi:MAG: type II toxin-antitoxin system VapC family toxin [Flavobacteriia bacterium]|nr:type II toxin-antitoxin system VapC family toxin [Flavobacteriia bacterium]
MAFLLDTHAFLWFVTGDEQLPKKVKSKIEEIDNRCFLSIASLWEITIKQQIGKLTLEISLEELFEYTVRNRFEVMQVTPNHLLALATLPMIHSDPFDRLIVSQALTENCTLP